MGSPLAVGVIHLYRRTLSPLKGFRCAHDVLHGHRSCSDFGLTVFRQHGLVAGARVMRARFAACREALATLQMAAPDRPSDEEPAKRKRTWTEACYCDVASGAVDALSCGGRGLRGGGDACASIDVCACAW